jgi:hypothetical protein
MDVVYEHVDNCDGFMLDSKHGECSAFDHRKLDGHLACDPADDNSQIFEVLKSGFTGDFKKYGDLVANFMMMENDHGKIIAFIDMVSLRDKVLNEISNIKSKADVIITEHNNQ